MFENSTELWSDVKFGELLNDHFYNLQKYKQISTVKIDRMVEICRENGAWGAKINGSGGKLSIIHFLFTWFLHHCLMLRWWLYVLLY